MVFLKKFFLALLVLLLLAGGFIAIWSQLPAVAKREAPDPAVALFNQHYADERTLKESYFEHQGNSLHYVEGGEGETVLFLHGFPSYWFSLVRQIAALHRDYRVIAIDGLGAGKSDAPRGVEHYDLEAMAQHIIALIDHRGLEKVHLIGHDWGSALAIGLAQRYPGRVISVTGISAPPLNATLHALERDDSARATASYVERFKKANPALLVALGTADTIYGGAYRPLVEDWKLTMEEGELFRKATSDPRRTNAHINWYRANVPSPNHLAERDFWPARDARVTVPALYVWGENDPIYNQVAIDRLMELSDQPEFLTIPKVGHWPHVRTANVVNAAVSEHLSKASQRPVN